MGITLHIGALTAAAIVKRRNRHLDGDGFPCLRIPDRQGQLTAAAAFTLTHGPGLSCQAPAFAGAFPSFLF